MQERTGEIGQSDNGFAGARTGLRMGVFSGEFAIMYPEELRSRREMGGLGVTARSVRGMEEEMPGIAARLESETGKVVFLGNGACGAPFVCRKAEEIVLVDAVGYNDLLGDLIDFSLILPEELKIRMEYFQILSRVKMIVTAVRKGKMQTVEYTVGNGEVPTEAKKADLAINFYGPSFRTIGDQLAMLGEKGELFINCEATELARIPEEFEVWPLAGRVNGITGVGSARIKKIG